MTSGPDPLAALREAEERALKMVRTISIAYTVALLDHEVPWADKRTLSEGADEALARYRDAVAARVREEERVKRAPPARKLGRLRSLVLNRQNKPRGWADLEAEVSRLAAENHRLQHGGTPHD